MQVDWKPGRVHQEDTSKEGQGHIRGGGPVLRDCGAEGEPELRAEIESERQGRSGRWVGLPVLPSCKEPGALDPRRDGGVCVCLYLQGHRPSEGWRVWTLSAFRGYQEEQSWFHGHLEHRRSFPYNCGYPGLENILPHEQHAIEWRHVPDLRWGPREHLHGSDAPVLAFLQVSMHPVAAVPPAALWPQASCLQTHWLIPNKSISEAGSRHLYSGCDFFSWLKMTKGN